MLRSLNILAAAAVWLCTQGAYAQVPDMDFLEGRWSIQDPAGSEIGVSEIEIQASGAMLIERRQVGDRSVQLLWLENSERNGGWTQLFLGPQGTVREFAPIVATTDWPLVLGGDVVLQDGAAVKFRMTLSRQSDDRTRRLLEMSRDGGQSWNVVFDYAYVRAAS